MAISGLIEAVSETPELDSVIGLASGHRSEQLLTGLTGAQKSLYIAALWSRGRSLGAAVPALVATYSPVQALRLHREIASMLPGEPVFLYPPLETFPHEEVTRNIELARARQQAMLALLDDEPALVIASVQALSERLIGPEAYRASLVRIEVGERLDLRALAARLASIGYERLERVEHPGEYSVRGGIVDIYPIARDEPVRLELFDDEVDGIRTFDPVTQRSTGGLQAVRVGPARELVLQDEGVEAGLRRIEAALERQAATLQRLGKEREAEALVERVGAHMEKIAAGIYFDGIDQYRPFFAADLTGLSVYVTRGYIIVDEPARTREHLDGTLRDFGEQHTAMLEKGRVLPQEAKLFAAWPDLYAEWRSHALVHLAGLDKRLPGMDPQRVIEVQAGSPESFHGRIDRLAASIREWRRRQFRVCMVLSTPERGARVVEAMKDEGLDAVFAPSLNGQLKTGNVVVTTGSLGAGCELRAQRLVVLTDAEVFGRQKRARPQRTGGEEPSRRITDFHDLKEGSYVVHVNHGIGKYVGVETLEINGGHKDYLVVQYAGEDRLYVPTDQVDLLQVYVGAEGHTAKLSKLGGNEWNRVKKRVKESVQEIASGLLKLYAEREAVQGHAFGPDTVWQQEFEDAFPYEETPDQLRAIRDVKRDMERPRPMDRLLCGDVGYGKTEVALRAAFKAVTDGKQVAVLVPTTILAQQHGRTFTERFEPYPVRVAVLSRFQSHAEQQEILRGIAAGSIDVVIGTHRLLSKDVTFKDLGLVVVDEEQRFGVVQKERLKELRKMVDVLTLTATPIPRTLHMAMVGVRDMSVIETPPEDRFPIRTYVVEYDEEIIREAILRELAREGQVYFVYNRVQSIDRMFQRLQELVPEARIAVAHGQMDEERLERVMLDFFQGAYDVLLCSTIIETGMDISNVNTLIVYDADRLGLAQLYQLRGRVGRSNRVAYAYFTYRREKLLSEDAEKRLQAIKEFTELGSGFKIALRDLEIRGAGNLLGPEQHGHIASVGFELYCRLLDESIKELKGNVVVAPPEPVLDLQVDAYIPERYIPDSQQKVEVYKKVLAARNLEDVDDLAEEIEDRFGPLPEPVEALLEVARLKCIARRLGVSQLTQERDGVTVRFHSGLSLPREVHVALLRDFRGKVQVLSGRSASVKVRVRGLDSAELLRLLGRVLSILQSAVA